MHVAEPIVQDVRAGAVPDGQLHADRGDGQHAHGACGVQPQQALVFRVVLEVRVACAVRTDDLADLHLLGGEPAVVLVGGFEPCVRVRGRGGRYLGGLGGGREPAVRHPLVQWGSADDGESAEEEQHGEQRVDAGDDPVPVFEPAAGPPDTMVQ